MKKTIYTIMTIAAIVFVIFLLWPDKQHDSHNNDHASVVADHDTLKAHNAESAHVIDSLNKTIAQKDSANKALRTGQQQTERKLNAKTSEVKTLVAQIREYNQDTGYFGHLLDSLQQQVESLTFLIAQYEQYADSINNVIDSLKITTAAKDAEKDKRIAEVQAAYDKLYKSYMELFGANQSLTKDLRRQKLKTKIAAVLGFVAAGVAAFAK